LSECRSHKQQSAVLSILPFRIIRRHNIIVSNVETYVPVLPMPRGKAPTRNILRNETFIVSMETVQHGNIKRRLVIRASLCCHRKTEINRCLFTEMLFIQMKVHHSIETNHNMDIQRDLLFYTNAVLHLGEWMPADYRCNLSSAENI